SPHGCGRVLAYRGLERSRNGLAIGGLVEGNGVSPGHHDIDTAAPSDTEQMRPERRAPVPGNERAMLTSKRQSQQARVGNRQRLDPYAPGVFRFRKRIPCCTDQRGAKGQHPVAVTRGAFAEQHNWIALGEPLRDFGIDLLGLVSPAAVDEYGSL